MSKRVVMVRVQSNEKQTISCAYAFDDIKESFKFKTLELAWKNNQNNISCIPAGRYKVVPRRSQKFKDHFEITGVPNRSLVLFHWGNYHTNTEGCVLSGNEFADINKDGFLDVTSSKIMHERLVQWAPEGFILDVIDTLEVKTALS